jgi:hypothetical protein
MPHIHWVARQNKLEIPRDKDEVNKREIHEPVRIISCSGNFFICLLLIDKARAKDKTYI